MDNQRQLRQKLEAMHDEGDTEDTRLAHNSDLFNPRQFAFLVSAATVQRTKDGPAQQGIFLGDGLNSNKDNSGKCSKFIDEHFLSSDAHQ
eukprot:5095401-Pyramimonas_sp.AAC.1